MTTNINITITTTFVVPDQTLLDIFTTALEGGIGYWSTCLRYKWLLPDGKTSDVLGFHADVLDEVGIGLTVLDVFVEGHRIDREVIARGLQLFANAKPEEVLREGPPEDWGCLDADAADQIVQLGLFGEVVYG